jgi:YcaO cyclodehydratase, ATP-ad Mg2+-binding
MLEQIVRHGITVTFATTPFNTAPSRRRSVAHFEFPVPHRPPVEFWGFSYGDSRAARTRATYEVYERLFAFRPFRRAYLPRVIPECFTLVGGKPTRRIASKHLFILEPGEMSAGSGVGAHTSLRAAIDHGFEEVVERHLLCRWWYEAAFRQVEPGVHLSSWTVSGGRIPFCVAVVTDVEETVFVTGSKVSATLAKARIGAEREAFMLYDSLPRDLSVKLPWRIASLRGPLGKKRIAHFRRSIDASQPGPARGSGPYSHGELATACDRSLRGARYAVLADLARIKVVKVHCPGWMTKSSARAKHERSAVPPDPFC